MPTKQKSPEANAKVRDAALDKLFSKALELFNAGKLKEAEPAFEQVREEAGKAEDIRLGRTAENYLRAIRSREATPAAPVAQAPELGVQLELNRRNPEAALVLADAALKQHPDAAGLHYLKAVALAQMDQAQPAAEALARATSLDAGFIYQFRLEADFDGVRHSAPFAAFSRG